MSSKHPRQNPTSSEIPVYASRPAFLAWAAALTVAGCGGRPAQGLEAGGGFDAQARPALYESEDCSPESPVSITKAALVNSDLIRMTLAGRAPHCPGHLKVGLVWSPTASWADAHESPAGVADYQEGEPESSLLLRFSPPDARGARYVGLVLYPESAGSTTRLVPFLRERKRQ